MSEEETSKGKACARRASLDPGKAGPGAPSEDSPGIMDLDELVRKYEVESRFRKLKGSWGTFATVLAVAMSLFHLYIAGPGIVVAMKQRAIHLGFAMVLIFLYYPAARRSPKDKPSVLDVVLAVVAGWSTFYLLQHYDTISARGLTTNKWDLFAGAVCMIMVLEAARRTIGYQLPVVALVFLAYAYFGRHIPGMFMHRGYSITRLIEHMYISAEGIFGVALGVSTTLIFLFILFGAFLSETGMTQFFTNLALALAGGSPGGPAKVAVLASGMLGMINGSAAANVVTTGTFTIPLMKSVGYKPHFAGAVEAVASTGGQIMPPVMGAAAFIMAEFLGVSYTKVMIAAAIPALLYYIACWSAVHLEAVRTGLRGIPRSSLPRVSEVIRRGGHLVIPVVVLVYMLLKQYTPSYAAFFCILLSLAVSMLKKESRITPPKLLNALTAGARTALGVAIACATVGFVVGVVTLTGLGLRLANLILMLSGGLLYPTLLLTMLASLILGMGLPTSACYIVSATAAAPALLALKVPEMAAHMFCFYFACISAITPPVALAAYAGAGVAGADPSTVGWTAVKLGIAGFLVPFIFVTSPTLLLMNRSILATAQAVITSSLGAYALAAAMEGFFKTSCNILERAVLLGAALLLIKPGTATDAVGLAVLAAMYAFQTLKSRRLSAMGEGGSATASR